MNKNKLFFAFNNRQFLYLWLGEVFTQIPVNLLNFLLILVVFDLTKSNIAVSAVVLSFTVPAILFGIIAGVYIDRWNKKHVLLLANIIRAILLIFLALFHSNIIIIILFSFLISVITQFFIPAESPIIPLIVKDIELLSANALFSIGIFGSILVAYLFSGPILLYLGIVKTFLLLAVMLTLATFLISLIKVPVSEQKKGFRLDTHIPLLAVIKELREVWQTLRSSRNISNSLILLALSQILILIVAAIAPGYANEVLHIKLEQFPLFVITPATIGIIIGALFITNFLHSIRKDKLVTAGIFLAGLIMIIMPYCSKIASKAFVKTINLYLPHTIQISNVELIIILSFLLGAANAFVYIPSNTLLQEETDDKIRGKVYGVLNTLVGILSFLPILIVGSFADLIGVSRVLIGLGIIMFGIAISRLYLERK